jgi:hypothetical protein
MVNMASKIKGLDCPVRLSISFSHKIYDACAGAYPVPWGEIGGGVEPARYNPFLSNDDFFRWKLYLPEKSRYPAACSGVVHSLEKIATSKKVSIAWVVREAVETYLERQTKGYVVAQDTKNV